MTRPDARIRKAYLAVSPADIVAMAEMLETGATLDDLLDEFPNHRPTALADLGAGWE